MVILKKKKEKTKNKNKEEQLENDVIIKCKCFLTFNIYLVHKSLSSFCSESSSRGFFTFFAVKEMKMDSVEKLSFVELQKSECNLSSALPLVMVRLGKPAC